jgi:hypothetical protein
MSDTIMRRVPVVGALGYVEHVRTLPASFTATLAVELENRYFRHAIAVLAGGKKAGYVAPEIAANIYDAVQTSAEPVTCPGRCASRADHETSGVELLLDLSGVNLQPHP